MKNFQNVGKVIRVGSRKLLVAGVILDTIELAEAVVHDLNDTDKKLGRETLTTSLTIAGRWGGSALGAQGGLNLGLLIGAAFSLGPATPVIGVGLAIIGGVIGSTKGDEFAEWIFDITELRD